MNFCELTECEFENFSFNHPLASFLQSPQMARIKSGDKWKTYYVGVKRDNEVICATLLLEYSGKLFKSFYSPRGYLIDFNDFELLNFFTKALKKFIKSKNGIVLNIEPNVLYKQRDSDGNLVEKGFDNTVVLDNLLKLGYHHNGFGLELEPTKQARFEYIIDIKGKTKEEIFTSFKTNTKNSIRKAQKYGIVTRILNYDELIDFKKLVDDSGTIKGFFCPNLDYYQKMYSIFNPLNQITFMIAEINISKYILELEKEIEEYKIKIEKINSKSNKKFLEYNTQIKNLENRVKEVKDETSHKTLILAGGMFIEYGDQTIYAFSGMLNKYKKLGAQYLVQWDMIQKSIERSCNIYNFYGITGDLNPTNNQYGVYEFKKGFGGNVIEYLGDFDLIVSPFKYKLLKFLKGVRR